MARRSGSGQPGRAAAGARGGARRARGGRLRGCDRGLRRIGAAIVRMRTRAPPEEGRGRGARGVRSGGPGRLDEGLHPRALPHGDSDRPDAGAGPAQAGGRFTAWRPAAADSWAPPAGRRSLALAPGPGPRVRGLRPARAPSLRPLARPLRGAAAAGEAARADHRPTPPQRPEGTGAGAGSRERGTKGQGIVLTRRKPR